MSKRPRKVAKGSSSSVQPFDSSKFVSLAAAERYKKMVVTKSFVVQRGFQSPGSLITGQIERRGWGEFTKRPIPAILPVVREFYANAKEHIDKTVFVRGKRISFAQEVINKYYSLREVDDTAFQQYRTQANYEEILNALTNGTVEWKRTANGEDVLHFPSAGLGYEYQAWHNFISANLLPSRHTSEVTRERAILNYAIAEEYEINVGRIIEQSILDIIAGHTTGGLGHPSLIYGLCLEKNVPATAEEEVLHPKAEMTWEMIQRYRRTAQDAEPRARRTRTYFPSAGSSSRAQTVHSSADMATLQQSMHQLMQQQMKILQQHDHMNVRLNSVFARQARLEARQEITLQYMTDMMKTGFQSLAGSRSIVFPPPPPMPPVSLDTEEDKGKDPVEEEEAEEDEDTSED